MHAGEDLGVTERVHRAVANARGAAQTFGAVRVGTEHLLLGLFTEKKGIVKSKKNFAAQVLVAANITEDKVREQIMLGWSPDKGAGAEVEFAFAASSKRVVELMRDEARRLGNDYVGTEHLLLGILEEPEGGAARVFAGLGADREEIRQRVMTALGANAVGANR